MITYVQWDPNSDDLTPLDLHQESLTIPPPIKINRTGLIILMSCFSVMMASLVIEETTIPSYVKHIAFIALGLSVTSFNIFCIVC